MKALSLVTLLALSSLVASCGEVFEATYRGTAEITNYCDPTANVQSGSYIVAIRVTVDGNINTRVIDIKRNGDSKPYSLVSLNDVRTVADFVGSKTDFDSGPRLAFSKDEKNKYELRGQLSTDRQNLIITDYKFVSPELGVSGGPCYTTMTGQFAKDS